MKKFFKDLERDFNLLVEKTVKINGQSVEDVASKHGINCVDNNFHVGCPGIMDPRDSVPIEFSWFSGTHNADKTNRANQLKSVLEIAEAAFYNDITLVTDKINTLDPRGLSILCSIIETSPHLQHYSDAKGVIIDELLKKKGDIFKYQNNGANKTILEIHLTDERLIKLCCDDQQLAGNAINDDNEFLNDPQD